MAATTKITLSDKELQLVCDTGWILTKHAIIQKVYALYGETLPALEKIIQQQTEYLSPVVLMQSPKISKGENYKLLPYVMLDYPRCFGKEDVLAVRTFFWWGHYFSVSLQLAGVFKTNARNTILQNFNSLGSKGYFICVGNNPWEHHFEETNFIAIANMTHQQFAGVLEKPFVKIAKKIPLIDWNNVQGFIISTFDELTDLVKTGQAPSR